MRARKDSDVAEDPVRQYLREIGAYGLLTASDEVRLATSIEQGLMAAEALAEAAADTGGRAKLSPAERRRLRVAVEAGRDAKTQFIQSNLRLVVSIAKRYQSSGLGLLDLVQEGNLGLIRAVEKFDHRKGFKFSTYATWWIRQAVTRAIADKGRTIRIPVHMVETVTQVTKSTARLVKTLGREPTCAEIAAECGLTEERVREAQSLVPDPISLFEPIGDADSPLADFLEDRNAEVPFDVAAAALQRDEVRSMLGALSEREQHVLALRFGLGGGEPVTLEEVGKRFELTRERIRQIEAKAMSKLRHPSMPAACKSLATAY